jgi:la-related protein 1
VLATADSVYQTPQEKKSKENEDDWEKVSLPSLPVDPQYKAAPVPAVNVWQVRREAQAAKLKEQQKTVVPTTTSQPRKVRSASEDLKRKSVAKDMSSTLENSKSTEGVATNHRKDMSSNRSSRPTSQQDEKRGGEAPPLVTDTTSWPTPETSNSEDRRKSTSLEKPDSKTGSQKVHGNKWVAVPFVPTAKFETQLPPAAARRGGRGGARGGRDAAGRGVSHGVPSVEKSDASNLMGPPPIPRHSGEQDRGRRPEGQQGARGASVPTGNMRPGSGEDAARASGSPDNKEQMASDNLTNVSTPAEAPVDEPVTKTEQSSRSSSRHTGNPPNRRVNGEKGGWGDQVGSGFYSSKDPAKYNQNYDRNRAPATGGPRGNGDFARDRGPGKGRDWSREKPESAHEKVESWRDRDSSGDQGNRRGGRSDRGRGSYRGRGDSNYTQGYNASHAYTSPLPQNGFEPPSRSASHTESRSRQASQPFVPAQAGNGTRNNPRSQSIPVGMVYPGYFNGMPGVPQHGLPNLQTDMSMYGYASQVPMQPSMMSAMPYNDPLSSFALLSMVTTQM